ncbi:MAG TPA: hypothetical protein VGW38_17530, partial [Chloroflexota bacterium]|nr:hypothetical protein [Chloroflexota bacterium]
RSALLPWAFLPTEDLSPTRGLSSNGAGLNGKPAGHRFQAMMRGAGPGRDDADGPTMHPLTRVNCALLGVPFD